MNNGITLKPIGYIKTPFKEKFGIPRQSNRVKANGKIVFFPEYKNPDAIRGLENFSYIWLIFDFTLSHTSNFYPTVRPPKLGGNTKMGVFATRSPFRPNPLGLSSVKLDGIINCEKELSILVSGVDLLDGTLIYDIKPYLPLSDVHIKASNGYAEKEKNHRIKVKGLKVLSNLEKEEKDLIRNCIAEDPRPSYQEDGRIYGMKMFNYNIRFTVEQNTATIISIETIE